jgi:hypothetical protein
MVFHDCNPTTWEAEQEFVSSRPAWATQQDPVSKKMKIKIKGRRTASRTGFLLLQQMTKEI